MVLTKGKLRVENSSEPINSCESGFSSDPTLASEMLAAGQTMDLARDPDEPLVTRQSKVSIGGLLFPLTEEDSFQLQCLFTAYEDLYHGVNDWKILTGRMRRMILHAAERSAGKDVLAFTYISLDPQDYTIFSCHLLNDIPVIKIHTRPEACWFLGYMRFTGTALGLNMGRMRVMRPTDKGVYPITLRTKYRALTNKVKEKEAVDAYRRLI